MYSCANSYHRTAAVVTSVVIAHITYCATLASRGSYRFYPILTVLNSTQTSEPWSVSASSLESCSYICMTKVCSAFAYDTAGGNCSIYHGSDTGTAKFPTFVSEFLCNGFVYGLTSLSCGLWNYSTSYAAAREIASWQYVQYLIVMDTHIARGKPASMSTRYRPSLYGPELGNDGVYTGPVAHTAQEVSPWWMVDLVNTYTVWALNFYNSNNPEPVVVARAINPSIRTGFTADIVSDSAHYDVCDSRTGSLPYGSTLLVCEEPLKARYVSIHLFKTATAATILHFREIEVHGFL